MDVGQCLGLPCFYKSAVHGKTESTTASTCGRTRQCCMPSVTSPVVVNCSHSTYDTSFIVTVIQKCACAICEERFTVVEGVLKTAMTGTLFPRNFYEYKSIYTATKQSK